MAKKAKKLTYRMDTDKFVEIWNKIYRDKLLGEDMVDLVREAFDTANPQYIKERKPSDHDLWEKCKSKMASLRKAIRAHNPAFNPPEITFRHRTGNIVRKDYSKIEQSLTSSFAPSKGDSYEAGIKKQRGK